jgi:hypothetical protein
LSSFRYTSVFRKNASAHLCPKHIYQDYNLSAKRKQGKFSHASEKIESSAVSGKVPPRRAARDIPEKTHHPRGKKGAAERKPHSAAPRISKLFLRIRRFRDFSAF